MKDTKENTQYIIRVAAEQFKNLKVVEFRPNRYVTKISGGNGAGKTSALDVLLHGLAPRKTLTPTLIRQGQKKGVIEIETNTHLVQRKLDEKGGGLRIEDKATGQLIKEPDEWLQDVAGGLGFDPLEFMNLKPEEQFGVLKGLLKLDADLDDLETRNADDAETITQRKAERRRLEAARDSIQIDKTLPAEPEDIEEILQQAQAIEANNNVIREEESQRESDRRQRDSFIRRMEDRTKQINRLRAEMESLEHENKQDGANLGQLNGVINEWKPLPQLKDRRELDAKVSEATRTNSAIATNNANKTQHERFEREVEAIGVQLERLEEDVRNRKIKIATTLEKAKFPVPGLSFETMTEGSGGRDRKNPKKVVTYNGIPLAEASSAEQIRVSAAIGMAGKADLRFLLIYHGSLLDDDGFAILEEMAHEHGFQILCEVVDKTGKVGVFIEDGEVKAVNAEPEPEPAAKPKKTGKKKEEPVA